MSLVTKLLSAVWAGLKAYPGGTAALAGVAAALVSRFGFHLDATQVAAVASIAAAVLGTFVHTTTVPKAKLTKP